MRTFGALILLAVLVATGLLAGPAPLSVADVCGAILRRLSGQPAEAIDAIVFQLRLPRVMAAVVVGAALAASGAAFQQLFRNPLVSSDILGVSSGAAFGAALALVAGAGGLIVEAAAFAGGLGAVALVCMIAAAVRRHDPILVLVLTGVVIGALLGAGLALVKLLADPYRDLPALTFWLLGSLAGAEPHTVWTAAIASAVGLAALWAVRGRLDVLALGDDDARALGVNVAAIRMVAIAGATLATAATVALAGMIGWIGLLVPHAARLLAGPHFARLMPLSALLGAAFLLAVDTAARMTTDAEVPLGVLTALLGAPLFLWLLARGRATA